MQTKESECSRKATFLVPTLRVIGKTEYSATIFRHRAVSRERDGGNASCTITVNSQPGIGSRFTVSLPLQREIFEEDVQVEFILNDSQSSAPHPVDSMKAPEEVEEKEDLRLIRMVSPYWW